MPGLSQQLLVAGPHEGGRHSLRCSTHDLVGQLVRKGRKALRGTPGLCSTSWAPVTIGLSSAEGQSWSFQGRQPGLCCPTRAVALWRAGLGWEDAGPQEEQ